jgi:predicted ester cyclase
VGHFPGFPLAQGVDGLKQLLTVYLTAFSNRRVTIEDALAEGDRVVVRTTFRGTHTGSLMGIPPTGKQVTVSALNFFRIVNGRAAEQWVNNDDMGMMQQLGVIPAPGK